MTEARPGQSDTWPTSTTESRRMRPSRALGPIVEVYEDLDAAYQKARRLGREYSVTGCNDGWCVRKWIDVEGSMNVVSFIGHAIRKANKSDCAKVNERAAREILAGMSAVELNEHIAELTTEHAAKKAGAQSTLEALARALSERCGRHGN